MIPRTFPAVSDLPGDPETTCYFRGRIILVEQLARLLEQTPDCVLVKREAGYLYAQWTTQRLKFIDDVEFLLDPVASVIHVRSASRLGSGDLGVNRLRVEALRARFAGGATATAVKQNK